LTLAFYPAIIKVAFAYKTCTKAKNKQFDPKYNSTLHNLKGSALLAVAEPFSFSKETPHGVSFCAQPPLQQRAPSDPYYE
jgi:hypothetical protein